ncbi:MAG: RNA polymerase sigma factor RpoH [Casimicrobiaceae bacterium]|nr:RNA polymerase sigma factor RpoH [Casimicrobiaceae bacterium]MCX8099564.1 RNA polymerase sigma factor RpoH [Casimicrobiaceae bacterium]MDW8313010.1 RNA polymerase sigma factor RpoH [Burkholderiales bacterium]
MSNAIATLNVPVPSAVGTLDQYIAAVNRYPILTAEQERELGLRWKYQQDIEAARQLVLSHLRLVVSVSRQYLGYGLPHGDLIQEGNVGLMKAVRRFDPERGVRLVSFALHWIRAEIHEFILRNWRLVKIATTKAQRKLFFNLRALRSEEQPLTLGEAKRIARELDVKPEEVMEMNLRLGGHDVPLEGSPEEHEEETLAPIAYLAADEDNDPARILEASETEARHSEGLKRALEKLDPRSRDIITRRWLAEDKEETLQQLADKYGVSAERIRQIEAKALKQMRKEIEG